MIDNITEYKITEDATKIIIDRDVTVVANENFKDLNDTPSSYTGEGGKVVSVKATEDGLEFTTGSPGSGDMTKAVYDSSNIAEQLIGETATQTLTNKTLTSPVINSPSGINKSDVGLGNVDNTSDTDKPVSTDQQTALDLKENLSNKLTAFQGTPDNAHYPSEKLVKDSLDTKQASGNYFDKSSDNLDDVSDGLTYVKSHNDYTDAEKTKLAACVAHDRIVYSKEIYTDGQNQLTSQNVVQFKVAYDGYLVGDSVILNTQRTSGTMDFKITVNGTPLSLTGLDIQINASIPSQQTKTVAYGNASYQITIGDVIAVELTTTVFQPLANRINVDIIIEKD